MRMTGHPERISQAGKLDGLRGSGSVNALELDAPASVATRTFVGQLHGTRRRSQPCSRLAPVT
jgi:hypothetical protein